MFRLTKCIIASITCLLISSVVNAESHEKKYPGYNDLRLIKEQEERRKKRKNEHSQVLQSIIASGTDTESVITLLENGKCFLTLGEYNSIIKYELLARWRNYLNLEEDTIPDIDFKSIQQEIINAKLKSAFVYDQWNKAKSNRVFIDSLNNENARLTDNLEMTVPDSIMKIRYQRYYQKLFSPKNNSLYYVFSSTDSALLYKFLSMHSEMSTNTKNKDDQHNLLKNDYTAFVFRYDSLPKNMKITADSIKTGKWSELKKISWGYYVMGLFRSNIKKEIPFKDAKKQLFFLMEVDESKFVIGDGQAFEFFDKNRGLFKTKDTLLLSLKIIPNIYNSEKRKEYADNELLSSLKTNEIKCTQLDLPENIVLKENNFGSDSCTGWVNFYNGKWNARLIGIKKGKNDGFEECKNIVKDYMLTNLKNNILDEFSSIPQKKADDRSYNLFENNFLNINKQKPEEFNKKIKNWAVENVKINYKYFNLK